MCRLTAGIRTRSTDAAGAMGSNLYTRQPLRCCATCATGAACLNLVHLSVAKSPARQLCMPVWHPLLQLTESGAASVIRKTVPVEFSIDLHAAGGETREVCHSRRLAPALAIA